MRFSSPVAEMSSKTIRAADPLFEVNVFLQLHVGPEMDQLDAGVGRADAVNAAEPLDDAHRIPMVVIKPLKT